MIRPLTLQENLEELRERLAKKINRPVYTAACNFSNGTHYRHPSKKRYVSMGALELFLSQWSDGSRCVKREGESYYYDLQEPQFLKLVFPAKKNENGLEALFSEVNLSPYLNSVHTVYLTRHDRDVPEELEPYVAQYKIRPGSPWRQGIRFVCSAHIENPKIEYKQWHFDLATDRLVTMRPPGRYGDTPHVVGENFNHFVVTDEDPGQCVVCRGASGERRHFATVSYDGSGAYPINHICKGCFKDASEQWMRLLESSQLPEAVR